MVLGPSASCLFVILTFFHVERLVALTNLPPTSSLLSMQRSGGAAIIPTSQALPSFEVVSIKPNEDPNADFYLRFTPDGFSTRSCAVKTLIKVAYGLKDDRLLINLPTEKEAYYDIEAKVGEGDLARYMGLSDVQKRGMLQSLLKDRFQFKFHFTTKELPVFALVVDKHGPKLKESRPDADGKIQKTMQVTGRYTIVATGWTTGDLFQNLYELSGRYVVDRTGLTGRYDFTLRCAPDPSRDPRQDVTFDGPVIFTALREQLGLALEPSTANLDAIVVDHLEAPTPN